MKAIGTRLEVWRGEADHTSGGLRRNDLMLNAHGKLVSKKQSMNARRNNNLGSYKIPAKRGQKGDGIIGDVVSGIGNLFGLGEAPAYVSRGGDIMPYVGRGGAVAYASRGGAMRGRGVVGDVAKGVSSALDWIGLGEKKRRPRRRKTMKGSGVLSDIWDGAKKVAGVAAPVLLPLGVQAAKSYFGGEGMRRRITKRDRAVDRKNGRKAKGW